ncbi:hypothetical protein HYQ46_007805 [Verticillium longisporum]|nr:hypothetical protein HYQ46_007805 [Verticillium longisporum]
MMAPRTASFVSTAQTVAVTSAGLARQDVILSAPNVTLAGFRALTRSVKGDEGNASATLRRVRRPFDANSWRA